MSDWITNFNTFMVSYLIPVGWKVIGAVVLWIVGSWTIKIIRNLLVGGMGAQKLDPTLIKYFDATIGVVLRMVLVIAILAVFGIQTTSFVAFIAAAGVAIGMAWGASWPTLRPEHF